MPVSDSKAVIRQIQVFSGPDRFVRAAAEDKRYWAARSPQERLAHLEELRREAYGDGEIDARLQRVLEIAQLQRR